MTSFNVYDLSFFHISTHTLTWSVTEPPREITPIVGISTHTLTWSVTITINLDSPEQSISTHTLTWSVTVTVNRQIVTKSDFNSHAHVERDEFVCKKCHDNFISTHTLTWSVTAQRERPEAIR